MAACKDSIVSPPRVECASREEEMNLKWMANTPYYKLDRL